MSAAATSFGRLFHCWLVLGEECFLSGLCHVIGQIVGLEWVGGWLFLSQPNDVGKYLEYILCEYGTLDCSTYRKICESL